MKDQKCSREHDPEDVTCGFCLEYREDIEKAIEKRTRKQILQKVEDMSSEDHLPDIFIDEKEWKRFRSELK